MVIKLSTFDTVSLSMGGDALLPAMWLLLVQAVEAAMQAEDAGDKLKAKAKKYF